jgi:hypothetical protein
MSNRREHYLKHGAKAAKLSLFFPGLGQLHNKHYFKGFVVMAIFCFALTFQVMLLTDAARQSNLPLLTIVFVSLFTIWGLSILDAYYSAIETRRFNAKRWNTQVFTTVRGFDVADSSFHETAVTKNLSKSGACLIMSTDVKPESRLSLEFEGKPKSLARVVWVRETGNRDERLVGVELLTPLREL